jgi:hypothetical protein
MPFGEIAGLAPAEQEGHRILVADEFLVEHNRCDEAVAAESRDIIEQAAVEATQRCQIAS